jgi:hypothetical protein
MLSSADLNNLENFKQTFLLKLQQFNASLTTVTPLRAEWDPTWQRFVFGDGQIMVTPQPIAAPGGGDPSLNLLKRMDITFHNFPEGFTSKAFNNFKRKYVRLDNATNLRITFKKIQICFEELKAYSHKVAVENEKRAQVFKVLKEKKERLAKENEMRAEQFDLMVKFAENNQLTIESMVENEFINLKLKDGIVARLEIHPEHVSIPVINLDYNTNDPAALLKLTHHFKGL